jgi:hypothetical protein
MGPVMALIAVGATDEATFRSILEELGHASSDRAAAIVGAVLVEESLTNLLRSRLGRDQNLLDQLFRSSGPLGAFSVKINLGFLMGFYTGDARKELETIKNIRNEFAHRIARSFDFDRIKGLANNLTMSEKIEFHYSIPEGNQEGNQMVLYIGTNSKPKDRPSEPVLPPIIPDQLTPRERYIRACHFFSNALSFAMHSIPISNPAVYF